MRPSDELKTTQLWQDDEQLRAIHARYARWTPTVWLPEQVSFDIGYLMGLIVQLESRLHPPTVQ